VRADDLTRKTNRGGVLDLERERFERLAEEIAEQLVAHHGGVTRLASTVEDVDLWRRAARRAGRVLGVSVRTGVAPDGSKVWVVDES
jgi:hypothetical protein